jgi:hypothetical protein
MHRAAVFIAILGLQVGCTSTRPAITAAPPPNLTAEGARDALLDFIRREPDFFAGRPDPKRLAQLPIKSTGGDQYTWSAFVIDTAARTYSADIGTEGPAPYFYNGTFELRDNVWIANGPQVQHMHQALPTPK